MEGIMQSKISQRKINTVWFHLYVETKKTNKWASITKQESQRYRQQTSGCQRGEGWGEERSRWGRLRSINSQLQNKWITGMKCTVWGIVNNYEKNLTARQISLILSLLHKATNSYHISKIILLRTWIKAICGTVISRKY